MNASRQPLQPRQDLGDLIRSRLVLLTVCRRCKHERILWPSSLIERFGEDCPAIGIRPFLRCSACRTRNANLHETGR